MHTEITDKEIRWVLYDGDCSLCTAWALRCKNTITRHGFTLAPLQEWRGGPLDLNEMKVITPDGTYGGADALLQIARRIWWALPLFWLTQMPGIRPLLRWVYRRVAANRHCLGGRCQVPNAVCICDWLPLATLPCAAIFVRNAIPAWHFMWALASTLYVGCKWLTFSMARRKLGKTRPTLAVAYLLAWPGMDAAAFLNPTRSAPRPRLVQWIFAVAKIGLGATLIWFDTPSVGHGNELLTGWIGMVGLMFCLHFGLFDLLALTWQATGVNVTPLMRSPLLADSLADFWGKRWNTAFHELAHRFLFRPALRATNGAGATLIVFLASGLIHDLVISIPARGGYGLPTAFFLIQGTAMLIERSAFGKTMGLGRGTRGWLFTMLVTIGPAFWLFHPQFINAVILPMLHAIGAT